MLTDPQREFVRRVAQTLQIIVGAMAAGVIMFLGVTIFLASQKVEVPPPAVPVVTYAAIGMTIVSVVAWLFVPGIASGNMRKALVEGRAKDWGLVKNLPNAAEVGDIAPLAAVYQTRTIISVAVLEGAAFLAIMAYMLEHQVISLCLAVALLLLILSQIPSKSKVESWLESERIAIDQLRQMR